MLAATDAVEMGAWRGGTTARRMTTLGDGADCCTFCECPSNPQCQTVQRCVATPKVARAAGSRDPAPGRLHPVGRARRSHAAPWREQGSDHATRTFSARGPLGPCPRSKVTVWPSRNSSKRVPAQADWWKKYSLPSLAAIKPNPLSVKRLIVPFIVAIVSLAV